MADFKVRVTQTWVTKIETGDPKAACDIAIKQGPTGPKLVTNCIAYEADNPDNFYHGNNANTVLRGTEKKKCT